MDIISHGLWGWLAFGRKSKSEYAPALFFGMLPDLFAFVPFFIYTKINNIHFRGAPPLEIMPPWVFFLYDLGHSLIIFAFFYIFIGRYSRKAAYCSLAWFLHILIDIPTHSADYFPTRFLYPFSDFIVDGWSWNSPVIWFPNLVLLLILYSAFIFASLQRKKKPCSLPL